MLLSSSALAVSRPARAEPLELTWQAPSDCPSGESVEEQFTRLIQARGRHDSSRRLVAVSKVDRARDGTWTVQLTTTLDGAQGARVLSGNSCAAVARATALILAFAWDPDSAGSPEPDLALMSSSAGPPVPEVASPPPHATPAHPAWRAHLGLKLVTAFSVLPEAVIAGRINAGARYDRLGIEVLAQVSQSRSVSLPNRPSAGGKFRFASGAAWLCAELLQTAVVGRVCGGGGIEHLWASGFGVSEPSSGSATLPIVLGGVQLAMPFTSRLAFQADALAAGRVDRPRFVLNGLGAVFEEPALSGFLGAGLELSF